MKTRIIRLAIVASLSAIAFANIASASAASPSLTGGPNTEECSALDRLHCLVVVTQFKAAGDNTKPAIDGLHHLVHTAQK